MVKYRNVFGDEYSGSVAKTGVLQNGKVDCTVENGLNPAPKNTSTNLCEIQFLQMPQNTRDSTHTRNKPMSPLPRAWWCQQQPLTSRWQKMSEAERAAYQDPKTCIKQVGSRILLRWKNNQHSRRPTILYCEWEPTRGWKIKFWQGYR